MRQRHARIALSWIAALAILLGAVTPSFAAWLGAPGGKVWLEVCTTNGIQQIALDDDAPDLPQVGHAGNHCLYCPLQQEHPAIAQAQAAGLAHDASGGISPPPAAPPPRVAAIWTAHQSRAPPRHA